MGDAFNVETVRISLDHHRACHWLAITETQSSNI